MTGPLAPTCRRRALRLGSVLATFVACAVTSGCGQTGPLALPRSAQSPSAPAGGAQTDEEAAASQDEERTENER